MYNILLFEQEDGDYPNSIDKECLVSLLEMIYEDYQAKQRTQLAIPERPKVPTKAYGNSETLEILRKIYQLCYRIVPKFEVSLSEVESGMFIYK